VIGVSFYGRGARVRLALCTHSEAAELVAIVPGHLAPAVGRKVGVTVTGEVVSFSRASDAGIHGEPAEPLSREPGRDKSYALMRSVPSM
jgi:hypothetical protein